MFSHLSKCAFTPSMFTRVLSACQTTTCSDMWKLARCPHSCCEAGDTERPWCVSRKVSRLGMHGRALQQQAGGGVGWGGGCHTGSLTSQQNLGGHYSLTAMVSICKPTATAGTGWSGNFNHDCLRQTAISGRTLQGPTMSKFLLFVGCLSLLFPAKEHYFI